MSKEKYILVSKPDELLDIRMKSILKTLVSLRKSRHISQAKLAELTGIDISNICRLEKGVNIPRLDTLLRILNVLEYCIIFEDDYLPF